MIFVQSPDTLAGGFLSSSPSGSVDLVLTLDSSDLSWAASPLSSTIFSGLRKGHTIHTEPPMSPRILPEPPKHKDWKPHRSGLAAPDTVKLHWSFPSPDNSLLCFPVRTSHTMTSFSTPSFSRGFMIVAVSQQQTFIEKFLVMAALGTSLSIVLQSSSSLLSIVQKTDAQGSDHLPRFSY